MNSIKNFLSPTSFIDAAKKAHPAFKYASVVLGLAAIVATTLKFGFNAAVIVFGIVILVVLMVLFLVFSKAVQLANAQKRGQLPGINLAASVLIWSFLLLCIFAAFLLFTSTFFDNPLHIKSAIERMIPPPIKGDTVLFELLDIVAESERDSQLQQSGISMVFNANSYNLSNFFNVTFSNKIANFDKDLVSRSFVPRKLRDKVKENFSIAIYLSDRSLNDNKPILIGQDNVFLDNQSGFGEHEITGQPYPPYSEHTFKIRYRLSLVQK